MTRLIWRIQFAAATVALGLLAGIARAADSTAPTSLPPVEVPAADSGPTTDTLPPATDDSASAAELPAPTSQPPAMPESATPAAEPAPACEACEGGTGFHPLATLREIHPLAPLRQIHPLAPMRQRFAECHTAPLFFPKPNGQPQGLAAPWNRQVAPCAYAGQPVQQVAPPSGGIVDPSAAGAAVDATGDGSSLGECCVERSATWFGGSDYLLIRPHQTYDSAFQIIPNGGSGSAVQNVNFNPSFGNAVRLFVGYETACDESLRFSYTYMFNDTIRSAAVPTGASILSPLGATLFPGDSIVATEHLLLNIWDFDDVRKLNFAWCNCKDCPRWDISWSWGVRTIQLDEAIVNSASGPDAGEFGQRSSFVGAGPRVGIDIHRQIGHSNLSAYVAADAALLVGEQRTTGGSTPTGSNGVQTLPNFDVQIGLSWQATCHLNLTGGYLFETFGDATQLSESASLALVAPPQSSTLSYDGFFFCGEFSY